MAKGPRGVVAITGAERGIGAAIARDLIGRGFTVAVLSIDARRPDPGKLTALQRKRLHAFACDITNETQAAKALAQAAKLPGGLVGLVNNAGIQKDGPSHRFPTADFEAVLRTNVLGTFAMCRLAHPHLVKQGGLIVNISSFWDRMGVKNQVAYAASKAAVSSITRSLAVEWAKEGIRVLAVAPGYIETDMNRAALANAKIQAYIAKRIPRGKSGVPEDIACVVGALYDTDMAFLTGEIIHVDGGQGIVH